MRKIIFFPTLIKAVIICSLFISCFSALLVAPDGSTLLVSVNPPSIPVGGTSTVTVVGYKPNGSPFPDGTVIFFSCNIGSIEPSMETENGIAQATFKSDDGRSGVAEIRVSSGNATLVTENEGETSGTTSVEYVSVYVGVAALDSLVITAYPQILPEHGGTSQIKVTAYDEYLNPLEDIPVVISSNSGSLQNQGNTLYTNSNGMVYDVLTTTTTANVTASSGSISSSTTITVESENGEAPVATFVYSPKNPGVGDDVYFNASGSYDSDGFIVRYEWYFGDGGESSELNPTHKYTESNTYTVLLVVYDNDGNVGTHSDTVIVE